jgi:glutaminyl-peptide cyclotransferase
LSQYFAFLLTFLILLLNSACTAVVNPATPQPSPTPVKIFDGQIAWQDVVKQVEMGPRIPGSQSHARLVEWAAAEFKNAGWTVEIQETNLMGHPIRNISAKRGSGQPWLILGAHYDTRQFADQDPNSTLKNQPVPGANDGASGVAVLLELARTLPTNIKGQVWLVLFDTEDQGNIPGWDWILGSRAYAQSLTTRPDAVVVIDMIGDADLNINQEKNSNPTITKEIWDIARQAGYPQFIPSPKFSMIDDHTPFLEKGISAVDLIDFDYPYWHTVSDTPDKVSASSLKAVGDVLTRWILSH